MPRRIEDYALLGDRRGAALVSRDGSIDLALPAPLHVALVHSAVNLGQWKRSG